jgi:hypothetical protein
MMDLKHIKELMGYVELKTIYMNQKTLDSVLEKIDFTPHNITVNNFLPDNQAILMNNEQQEQAHFTHFTHM